MKLNRSYLLLPVLVSAMALTGCASQPPVPPAKVPVQVQRAQLPDPPPELMVPVQADFLARLQTFLGVKLSGPMLSPDASSKPSN